MQTFDSATYPTGDYPAPTNVAPPPDPWHRIRTIKPQDALVVGGMPTIPYDLDPRYRLMLGELLDIWAGCLAKNQLRYRYYEGKNRLKDFGISTPPELLRVETVVNWPNKAVSALADRVRFDGFSSPDDEVQGILDEVSRRSRLATKTRQSIHSELIYGPAFATVGMTQYGPRIEFHSAECASAVWDDAQGRIAYGLVIDAFENGAPAYMRLLTDDAQVTLWLDGASWQWQIYPIGMGRAPMERFVYRPTDKHPFGQSRISRAVMSITDSAVRCCLGGDIAYQFAVSPQKYLLGTDSNPFQNKTRWEAYIGNWLAVGYNGKDGIMPQVGQMPQPSMQQYNDYLRSLAARFSETTNIPISQLGVIHDNPASAEAIYAASEPLIIEATDVIEDCRESMRSLAQMCVAAELDVPFDALTPEQRDITPNYRNPAMPSIVSMADAAVKLASVVDGFAGTPQFWKMVGLPEDARREVEQANREAATNALIAGVFGGGDGGDNG